MHQYSRFQFQLRSLGHIQFLLIMLSMGRWPRSYCASFEWHGRVMKPNWCLMTFCFPPIPLDGHFIRRCKQGCLQFVIFKPLLVAITLILCAKGKYEDGNLSPMQAYLYLNMIYTFSYSMALYALVLFYVACKDLLQPFNPVPKFILIKSVVFLTYWQGVLVFLAAKSGLIKDTKEPAEFQSFIICVEMLIASVGIFMHFHTRNVLLKGERLSV